MTDLPPDRPTGGRRRAPVSAVQTPEIDEAVHSAAPPEQPGDEPISPSWSGEAATAADLSASVTVGEGYAASRAARRLPTPSARVTVQPAQPTPQGHSSSPEQPGPDATEELSDLRPHPIPRELIEPSPRPEREGPSTAILAPEADQAAVSDAAPQASSHTFEAPPQPPRVEPTTPPALPPSAFAEAQTMPPPSAATARTQPEPAEPLTEASTQVEAARSTWKFSILLCLLAVGGAVAAGTRIADAQGWISSAGDTARIGALVATWAAIVGLTQRCGGRVVVVGAFAGTLAVVIGAFPEQWALAGAATAGAVAFGLLGMVLTRPQRGLRTLAELVLSAFIGLVGAVVVSGYDVVLRPYRFRILVLGLVLIAALALAWQLGRGRRSIGRRGAVVIVFGVLVLAASVAYAQAIRSWGSPGVLESISDFDSWLSDTIGASPRPVEALVGFPLLVWGVAFRRRNRQGWWMCAFGSLGAAGITSSLIQMTTLSESLESTGYSVLIGAILGLVAIGLDRVLTGGGGRKADVSAAAAAERQEPARFDALL